MKSNIALIGMMGSGKTVTAEELHKIFFDYVLIDIDKEIEKSSGKKIPELFLKFGESYFRMLESNKIKKYVSGSRQIISLGGGAFEDEFNRKNIKTNCTVIYLKASAEEIFNRIKTEFHRPLLHKNFSVERINEIMSRREQNYTKADITISTDGKTPQQTALEISEVLNGKH